MDALTTVLKYAPNATQAMAGMGPTVKIALKCLAESQTVKSAISTPLAHPLHALNARETWSRIRLGPLAYRAELMKARTQITMGVKLVLA